MKILAEKYQTRVMVSQLIQEVSGSDILTCGLLSGVTLVAPTSRELSSKNGFRLPIRTVCRWL